MYLSLKKNDWLPQNGNLLKISPSFNIYKFEHYLTFCMSNFEHKKQAVLNDVGAFSIVQIS